MTRLHSSPYWLLLTCLIGIFPAPTHGDQDPNDLGAADTVIVRPHSVVIPGPPWPDSVGVPVFYWGDNAVGGFRLGFDITGAIPGNGTVDDFLTISSVSHASTDVPSSSWLWTPVTINVAENQILFGALDFSGANPWHPPVGELATIWYQVDPNLPAGTVVSIDSAFVPPGGTFLVTVFTESGAASMTPMFSNSNELGLPTMLFGKAPCGDTDRDGALTISDAVYVVQYIFAGGPAPVPLARGDANCSGRVNLTDIVYLIQHIFAGGPAPCDTDGDGLPECWVQAEPRRIPLQQ